MNVIYQTPSGACKLLQPGEAHLSGAWRSSQPPGRATSLLQAQPARITWVKGLPCMPSLCSQSSCYVQRLSIANALMARKALAALGAPAPKYHVQGERTHQDCLWHLKKKTRQDKTRQDKTRQDKTRQDKTRQDKRRECYRHAHVRPAYRPQTKHAQQHANFSSRCHQLLCNEPHSADS